jgi:anti-sigma factor RsiW
MKCQAFEKRLSAYEDRELPISEYEEISGHLADCASCRETYEKFKLLWRRLDDLQPIPPPPGFYGQVHRRIHQIPEYGLWGALHWGSGWFKALPSSAVTAIILAGGIVIGAYFGSFLVRLDLFHGSVAFSEGSLLNSLRVFDPSPPGSLADGLERLMAYNEGHHKHK